MPELPDVETFKRYLNATALHHRIRHTRVLDERLLHGTPIQRLNHRLKGNRFEETRRHGKFLFVRTQTGDWLVLHFGMSGQLQYGRNVGQPPQYARVTFEFANGYRLLCLSRRVLGRVSLTDSPEHFRKEERLGIDALHPRLNLAHLQSLLEGRRGSIKGFLMDQSSMAGLGNIYSDEVLFQARIHPGRAVATLRKPEIRRLFRSIRSVLRTATNRQADPSRLPDSWLLTHRHGDKHCPRCGRRLQTRKMAGRTATFCRHCQG